jgi:hypothetical protein
VRDILAGKDYAGRLYFVQEYFCRPAQSHIPLSTDKRRFLISPFGKICDQQIRNASNIAGYRIVFSSLPLYAKMTGPEDRQKTHCILSLAYNFRVFLSLPVEFL